MTPLHQEFASTTVPPVGQVQDASLASFAVSSLATACPLSRLWRHETDQVPVSERLRVDSGHKFDGEPNIGGVAG